MFNIIAKKFPPYLYLPTRRAHFSIYKPFPHWPDLQDLVNKSDPDSNPFTFLSNKSYPSFTYNSADQPESNQDNDDDECFVALKITDKNKKSRMYHDAQEEAISNKIIQAQSLKFIKEKPKICKFSHHSAPRARNSEKFMHTLACLLTDSEAKKIVRLLQKFLKEEGFIEVADSQATKKERQLFKNLRKILFESLQDNEAVEGLMKLFAASDPSCIQFQELSRIRELFKTTNLTQKQDKSTLSIFNSESSSLFVEKSISKLLNAARMGEKKQEQQEKQKGKHEFFHFIKENTRQKQRDNKLSIIKKKLELRKEEVHSVFQADETNLQQVEKIIFGNKKMMTEQVVFRRVENRKVIQKRQNFGKNWVYAYDLPYSLDRSQADEIIKMIQKNYGPVAEYSINSYQNMVELNEEQIVFVIPENHLEESTKNNRIKLQKIKVQNNIKDLMKKKEQNLTSKILQKTKKDKKLNLNKSSMVLKFKNYEDKNRFLTPQMRLYGLNINDMKNVKFQQAQSKKVVALNMIPWGCDSSELIRLINQSLEPLMISVTHPNCIVARSYIFIELGNFYQALFGKDLLNNVIFQNQRLKAQILYGASEIQNGEFKYNLELNHYDTLTQKLSELRETYNQLHQ